MDCTIRLRGAYILVANRLRKQKCRSVGASLANRCTGRLGSISISKILLLHVLYTEKGAWKTTSAAVDCQGARLPVCSVHSASYHGSFSHQPNSYLLHLPRESISLLRVLSPLLSLVSTKRCAFTFVLSLDLCVALRSPQPLRHTIDSTSLSHTGPSNRRNEHRC
jgi:hypothetical protein